jgi:hypothetical protein
VVTCHTDASVSDELELAEQQPKWGLDPTDEGAIDVVREQPEKEESEPWRESRDKREQARHVRSIKRREHFSSSVAARVRASVVGLLMRWETAARARPRREIL